MSSRHHLRGCRTVSAAQRARKPASVMPSGPLSTSRPSCGAPTHGLRRQGGMPGCRSQSERWQNVVRTTIKVASKSKKTGTPLADTDCCILCIHAHRFEQHSMMLEMSAKLWESGAATGCRPAAPCTRAPRRCVRIANTAPRVTHEAGAVDHMSSCSAADSAPSRSRSARLKALLRKSFPASVSSTTCADEPCSDH